MIVDTNALTAVLQGQREILELVSTRKLFVPTIVLGEYWYGLARSTHKETLGAGLQALLRHNFILPVTELTARHYAVVREELRFQGTPISPNDVWIASLAREHEMELLSHDQDFDRVHKLVRVGWQ